MSLLSLVLVVLVLCVMVWVVRSLLAAFGVGEPLRTVVYVVVVLICLVYFLGVVGWLPSGTVRLQ